jgi:hypothetical protein
MQFAIAEAVSWLFVAIIPSLFAYYGIEWAYRFFIEAVD